MAALFADYLTHRDFPGAFVWAEQKPRWQRAMTIISPIYQINELVHKTASSARQCPFSK
jgi:hypothetical protein